MKDSTRHHRHVWPSQRRAARRDRIKTVLAIVFFVIAYGIVGTMDYEDAVAMEEIRTASTSQTTNL